MECAAHRDGTAQNKSLRPFGCRLFLMGSGWGPAAYCALAADAGADAGAAAGALAAGSGACTASAPCFSPPMSALSPAVMITYIDKAANKTKPTTIFHISISPGMGLFNQGAWLGMPCTIRRAVCICGLRRPAALQILAIATAIAAFCALQPIPIRSAHLPLESCTASPRLWVVLVRGTSPLMEHRARPLRGGPCTPVSKDQSLA